MWVLLKAWKTCEIFILQGLITVQILVLVEIGNAGPFENELSQFLILGGPQINPNDASLQKVVLPTKKWISRNFL